MSHYTLKDIKSLDEIIAEHVVYMEVDDGEPPPPLNMPHDGAMGMFQFDTPGNQCSCFYWSTPDADFVQVEWAPQYLEIYQHTFCIAPDLSNVPALLGL